MNLKKENIKNIYALTAMQEGMYLDFLLKKPERTYFEQLSFTQNGTLDIALLKESFNRLIQRYDTLRTVFSHKVTEKPLQIVLKEAEIDFSFVELKNGTDAEKVIMDYKINDSERYFDLNKGPLLRITVFKLNDELYKFIWSWHHIIMDAWCIEILAKDTLSIYKSLVDRTPLKLDVVKPYSNYIQWLEKKDRLNSELFWSAYLRGIEEPAQIDLISHKPDKETGRAQTVLLFDTDTTREIQQLASKWNVTLNIFIQGIWGVLLSKITDKKDVVFGAVVSGRPSDVDGIESMVGLFINTVPVRVNIKEEHSFSSVLKKMQSSALEAELHHYYPLADIFSKNELKHDVINHVLVFQNFPFSEVKEAEENSYLKLSDFDVQENFFYALNVFTYVQENISIIFEFDSSKYEKQSIASLADYMKYLIQQVLDNPELNIDQLSLVSADENIRLADFNPTSRKLEEKSFIKLFEEQVEKTPLNKAIVFNGDSWSYSNLNAEANKLSHFLKAQYQLKPNDVVTVLMDRSERLIIALLAILKTGAAFLPVEPGYPVERKRKMISDCGSTLLLTDSNYLLDVIEYYSGEIFAVDIQLDGLENAAHNPEIIASPSNLMYVIFTSGSTGNPKGVQIMNSSLVNYVIWANEYYFKNESGYTFGLFTPISFDLTLTSILTTLLRGDLLEIYTNDDISNIIRAVFDSSSTTNTVKITPSHIDLLSYLELEKTNVQCAIVGGEELKPEQVKLLRSLNSNIRIYNEYGPTETTIGCTVKEILNENDISIGKPIANTSILILDGEMNRVPVGVIGEIYISGAGVSSGYINNPVFTAEKFIENLHKTAGLTYKTGDLGRWTINGEIQFLGRKDSQVKIRGYRVELSEIESVIVQYPAVKSAVVLLDESSTGQEIIAFLVVDDEVYLDELKSYIKTRLPLYMVPVQFILINEVPLTSNGKINRKELFKLKGQSTQPSNPVPGNKYEEDLLAIWKEVLHKNAIGMEDNFFEIGGNSLMVVKLLSLISKSYADLLSIADLFDYPTIAGQASYIQNKLIPVSDNKAVSAANIIEF